MKIGDLVTINQSSYRQPQWEEAEGQVGVIIAFRAGSMMMVARVMVLGELAEFDIDELEAV